MRKHFTGKSLLYLALIFTIIISYFYTIIRASINFPIMDDYDAILNFLISYDDSTHLYEKIVAVFSQHNEHRIVYTRLIVLGYHKIFGAINFLLLIVIGNLSLVGILYLFFKVLKVELIEKRLLIFIPVALFLFNYRYAELSCWAMTSIQNIGVLFFAFLSLYFLLRDQKPSIAWAIVFATVATYTSGNGILTFVTGIIVLLLKKSPRKSIFMFGGAFILNLATYFIGLKKVAGHPPFLQSFIANPQDFFLYPLTFIGSLFYNQVTHINFIIGGIVLVIFILILVKKIYHKNYILFSFLLFMLFTVGVITISRFGFGVQQATSSRYAVNSSLIYIILGLIFCEIYYLKTTYKFYIPFLMFIILFHWISADSIKGQLIATDLERRIIAQINKGKVTEYNLYYLPSGYATAINILKQGSEKGIFVTNSVGYVSRAQKLKYNFIIDTTKIEYSIDESSWENDSIYKVTGWMFVKNIPSYQSKIMIGLEDSISQMYVEKSQLLFRNDVTQSHRKHDCDYNRSGFAKLINISKYPKGAYKLNVLISADSLNLKVPLQTTITR